MKKSRRNSIGTWKQVFVKNDGVSQEDFDEEVERQKRERVYERVGLGSMMAGLYGRDKNERMRLRFAAAEAVQDYFPGNNKVPDGGCWVLIRKPPHTEYTVPPLSIWFADPWPMQGELDSSHRVRIVTPRGDLGLFPREYSRLENPEKFYEFIGEGMEIKFFGAADDAMSPDLRQQLFYIRSRGVSKREALSMLIGNIKAHGVCWIESSREVCAAFGMDWHPDTQLATIPTPETKQQPEQNNDPENK